MRTHILMTLIVIVVTLMYVTSTANQPDLPDLAVEATLRSHSETITQFPHSYHIRIPEGLPIENESVRIEVLKGTSQNPSLKSNGNVDFSSLKTIVNEVVTPGMTDEQKAVALWRFVMNSCYQGRWGTSFDALEHLNVYGYGHCGTFAAVLESLWWTAGLKSRHVNIGNHAATEVFYDNDWHYIDSHSRSFFLEKDNETIASLEDLNDDPELWNMQRVKRNLQKGGKKYYYMTMHPGGKGSPEYRRDFIMAKGDVLTLTWRKSGKWCYARGQEGGSEPAPEPPIYANGIFTFRRDMSRPDQYLAGLIHTKNIDQQDAVSGYLHPKRVGEEAYMVYQIKVPYFIPDVAVTGKFIRKHVTDSASIDFSNDNGKSWVPIWNASETGIISARGSTDQTQKITTNVPWKYSYLIRVRMQARSSPLDAGCYLIESSAALVYNPKSLPGLRNGENVLTFRDDGLSGRTLKVTCAWQEDLPLKISKEAPLEGEEVVVSARVVNHGKGSAKDVPVVFYLGDPNRGGAEIGRDVISSMRPGATSEAKIRWKATRIMPGKKVANAAATVYAVVDPKNVIQETSKVNNSFSRTVQVAHPPEVSIPSASFIKFERKTDNPNILTVIATVRNFSSASYYGYYLSDHASAEAAVVTFLDGEPNKGKQIGDKQIIKGLLPLEFKNVAVDWDISRLTGVRKIYVQVTAPKNLVQALGPRPYKLISTSFDVDAYRACAGSKKPVN